jgi:orotate phosphoribosyltransferase
MSENSTNGHAVDQNAVMQLFEETGALLRGHFVLTSGLHSPNYLQCARVLQYPNHAETLGRAIADHFRDHRVSCVVAPALGGIVIGHEVARALGSRSIFTERDSNDEMTLRRGFSLNTDERVLVVEDVITTGGSTRETIEAAISAGGKVIGAASVIDRSGGTADVGVPRFALATLQVETYDPASCPLCATGSKAVKPGSRRQ